MKFIVLLISVLVTQSVFSQTYTLKGSLKDAGDSSALRGATVMLSGSADTSAAIRSVSGRDGSFELKNLEAGDYLLTISFIGYELLQRNISVTGSEYDLGNILISKRASILEEVLVKAQTPPVKQKNDTLEYNAGSFKVNPDATADDMIRKMPGITVENGTVKAGGEDVRKVTVDGRDFFGEDATAALKNLPAELIDKVQVFDRLSDQSRFTGFEDGNTTKAINIVTRADMRNGQFGRMYAGYGTDSRYSAGGNVSFFNGARRISLIGQANNTNQQNFATEDLLGISNSGGGGGRGGGRNMSGGGNGNFLVGQQGGISKTNAIGINYSDAWGAKTDVTGSYFFNNARNTSSEKLRRAFFTGGDSSRLYDENSLATSTNNNHRVNLRIEHKIDSNNTLLFTPNISFQDNHSYNEMQGVNSVRTNSITSRSVSTNSRSAGGFNFGNGILYRHSFAKKGRTVSANINLSFNKRDGETYLNAFNTSFYNGGASDTLMQFTDRKSNGRTISANLVYTEPIGKKGQLQINYNPSWNKNESDQLTYRFETSAGKYNQLDTSLSSAFENRYITQNGGLSYRTGDRDNTFSIGVGVQEAKLTGETVFPAETGINRRFRNLLPNMMWRKKLSAKSNIRLMYRTGTNPPSIGQLQDVINNSNPLFLRTGNPALAQEYSHRLIGRYTFTNSLKGQSFFANVFFQRTDNYVANATYIAQNDSMISKTVMLYRGSQLTKPVNVNGYWNMRSFVTFSTPLNFVKSNLNLNAGYSFGKTPGLVNQVLNTSKTSNWSLGAVLASNVSENIDFNLSYTANFNTVENSIQPQLNNNYFTQTAGLQVNLLSRTGWFLQNDINNRSYRGLADEFNQSFWLWNMSAGKKFLKNQRADLRLSVFDLLKQNRSISRTTSETYIEDMQTQVLQQYFMLTFSYRLRNFRASR